MDAVVGLLELHRHSAHDVVDVRCVGFKYVRGGFGRYRFGPKFLNLIPKLSFGCTNNMPLVAVWSYLVLWVWMLPYSHWRFVFWWFGFPRRLQSVGCGIVTFVVCSRQYAQICVVSLAQFVWSFIQMALAGSFFLTPVIHSLVGRPCLSLLRCLICDSEVVDVMARSFVRLGARLGLVVEIPCIGRLACVAVGD